MKPVKADIESFKVSELYLYFVPLPFVYSVLSESYDQGIESFLEAI